VAVKTSNSGKDEADVFLEFTAYMAEHLLKCNYKPRGGICKGQLYIDDVFVWGKGLVDAYMMESAEADYPRIIIAPEVVDGASKHLKDAMIEEDTDGKFILNYLKSFGKSKNSWIRDITEEYASISAEIEAFQQAHEETEDLKKSPECEKVTKKDKILKKLLWLQAFEKRNLEFWNHQ
jgi:predicted DNA-binding protein